MNTSQRRSKLTRILHVAEKKSVDARSANVNDVVETMADIARSGSAAIANLVIPEIVQAPYVGRFPVPCGGGSACSSKVYQVTIRMSKAARNYSIDVLCLNQRPAVTNISAHR